MSLTTNNELALLSAAVIAVVFLLFFQQMELADSSPSPTQDIIGQPTATVTPEALEAMSEQIEKEIEVKEAEDEETPAPGVPDYIKVTDGCGPYYGGDCLNVRREPDTTSKVVSRLRNGQVLKVAERVEADGRSWYKIIFDEWLRHPDRVEGDWYVAAEFVSPVPEKVLEEPTQATSSSSTKRIVIDLSEQTLYAYEGEEVFMKEPVSTGSVGAVTPRGHFTVFYRTPSRYMQGPIPGITDDDYDLPGVPWNLYFTQQGAVIHGAYWHDNFGMNWSHGCVNLPPEKAQQLYSWTPEGTEVIVQD